MLRRNIVRGAEMHLRKLPQCFRAGLLDDLSRRLLHGIGNAALERAAEDFRVGADPFTILDSAFQKLPRDFAIGENTGDHERPEKIAFPALIDSKMRLEHLGRMQLLVAEPRDAENLRLQLEGDEILDAFP